MASSKQNYIDNTTEQDNTTKNKQLNLYLENQKDHLMQLSRCIIGLEDKEDKEKEITTLMLNFHGEQVQKLQKIWKLYRTS